MNKLMKRLGQEHSGLRKLLALLNHKLQRLENGIPPDFSLIEDAIDYIEEYTGRYHHPVEDIICQYAVEHHLDDQGHFAKVTEEHKELAELTLEVKSSLHAILMDIIVSREEFIGHLRNYIQAEQSHLDHEDRVIFPLLDNLLNDQDWSRIINDNPQQIEDPLFGNRVQVEFQDLYQRLTEMDNS